MSVQTMNQQKMQNAANKVHVIIDTVFISFVIYIKLIICHLITEHASGGLEYLLINVELNLAIGIKLMCV